MQEKSPFGNMKLFFLIYFAALILILTFVGIMGWLGYEMVDASMKFMLFGLLMGSAMIAGAWWLVRKIWRRWLKVIVGVGLSALILAVILAMYFAFTLILVMNTPLHYTTIISPGGEAVVVMRSAVVLDEAVEGDQLAYSYSAHPRKLRFFYEKEYATSGSVQICRSSDAQLMYNWTDDTTMQLYVDAPGPGDGGTLEYHVK